MSDHTPTPWSLRDHWLMSPAGPVPIASGYQDWVTAPGGSRYEEWKSNAALIVRAINSHEAREKALELIADIAEGSQTVNSLPHIAKIARDTLGGNRE